VLALLLVLMQARELEPRTASWEELGREVFEPAWILPEGLPLAPGEDGLALELEVELLRVATLVVEPSATDPGAPRSLGDLAAAADGLAPDGIAALLARTERAQPTLWRALAPFAQELLRDEKLRSKRWDPEKDVGNDGIVLARALTLAEATSAPWNALHGSRQVQQGAMLVRADLATLKAVENDFTRYPGRPGTSYESIAAVPGSFLRGTDPAGQPFSALKVRFESDLPFPFSSYDCDLRILNRVRSDGRVVCDIASPSPDFHWMAGRDLYLSLETSSGAFVGTLVVRLFGFDLVNVPDGDDARRSGLRSSLGSLKREAEALWGERGPDAPPPSGSLPEFRVRSGS
jgi:hypothetical protein